MAAAARCILVWAACLLVAGCNQLFGIERLQPAAASPQAGAGAPAAGGGAGAAARDEDAGS